jgi:hypothetical protein
MLKKAALFFAISLNIGFSNAQKLGFFGEIGISAGPVFFQSDYGQRDVFKNYIQNNGFSVTGSYFLTPDHDYHDFREHFRFRFDLSYMNCELQHYGRWVEPWKTNTFAQQLRAMRGEVTTLGLGTQVEFYPWKTEETRNDRRQFYPYLSLGGQVANYTSKATSLLGPMGSAVATPDKYINGFRNDTKVVGAVSTSIGTRYLLDDYHALFIDARVQYYFSDWVDGLNPDRRIYDENKANDWISSVSVGYIYYFHEKK